MFVHQLLSSSSYLVDVVAFGHLQGYYLYPFTVLLFSKLYFTVRIIWNEIYVKFAIYEVYRHEIVISYIFGYIFRYLAGYRIPLLSISEVNFIRHHS